MLLNKADLAKALHCSRQTVDAHMDRYGAEFPVVERGGYGKEWVFDSDVVAAFLAGKKDERQRAKERHGVELAEQPGLPLTAHCDPVIAKREALRVTQDAIDANDLRLRAALHRIALQNKGADQVMRQVEEAVQGWQRELGNDLARRLRDLSPD